MNSWRKVNLFSRETERVRKELKERVHEETNLAATDIHM